MKYADGSGYGLHEVYYDDAGKENGMTVELADFICQDDEGPQGIILSLERALNDAKNKPVFNEPPEWAKKPN